MKNNHTQLKRLAAISLCLVMCLSALPFMAPSASAAPAADPIEVGAQAGVQGGYVCITFDDGFKGVHDVALPALSAHGMVATAYVITDYIGGTFANQQCMSAAELLALQEAGWEVGSHSLSHVRLDQLTIENAEAQFRDSKAALEALGLEVSTFAYPYGKANDAYTDEIVALGAEYYERQRSTEPDYMFLSEYPDVIEVVGSHFVGSQRNLEHILDMAAYSDSVAVLTYHGLGPDGMLLRGEGAPMGYTIYDLIACIEARGMETILFRDLPQSDRDVYIWDNGGATDLASDPANWKKIAADGMIVDDAPLESDAYYWWNDGSDNCTLDWDSSDIVPYAILMDRYYTGQITLASDKQLSVGEGGIRLHGFEVGTAGKMFPNLNNHIVCDGPLWAHSKFIDYKNYDITLTAERTFVLCQFGGRFTIHGDVLLAGPGHYVYPGTSTIFSLTIMPGASWCVPDGGRCNINDYAGGSFANAGRVYGDGAIDFVYYTTSSWEPRSYGTVTCDATIRLHAESGKGGIVPLAADATFSHLVIQSENAQYDIGVDLAGHSLTASSVVVGLRGAIGNGTVHTTSWDSTAGSILGNTNVVLADGGSAVLAPGQSFNELYIASDDGRSATWSMTATGAQAPIVTGLKSGSYLWYLDGVEQGEVKAGKDGTIELSYQSTGLHTLEVKPTPMTEAMDGMAAAVGIVAVLAVLGGLITMVGRIKF